MKSFHRNPFESPEIQLARSKNRERLDLEAMAMRGHKQIRKAGGCGLRQNLRQSFLGEGMQNGQLLSFAFIRHAGDRAHW